MATTGAEVFCDTNVLVAAVDRRRHLHRQALHVLNDLPNRGFGLCVSGQVLRELLVVSTRPRAANGLGLSRGAAVDNVRAVVGRCRVLEETRAVAARLLALIAAAGSMGRQIHDANLVATMLEHGVTALITDNLDDFRRYAGIELWSLAALPEPAR
jgi:predicted nucleic acid-binding protein